MDIEKIKTLFTEFLDDYNQDEKDNIWEIQSNEFKSFWQEKILSNNIEEINDQEIDEIIRFLDRNALGNTKDTEAIARVMVPQGAWRRMFNQIHKQKKLSNILSKIFKETDLSKKAQFIDDLFKINIGNKNNLTGKTASTINAFLALYNPQNQLSIISLNDRQLIIDYLDIRSTINKDVSIGLKTVQTNIEILDFFRNVVRINGTARTISRFCYSSKMLQLWKTKQDIFQLKTKDKINIENKTNDDNFLFYMEKQLEDFIIENWDKTEFGSRF
ncbi:MAG: hypothetical protein GY830_09090 [Bacteroidetes bacterium]|nr:hypothetical protein [Bacteroidota bacterium]